VRILLLNLGTRSLEAVNAALTGQGYDLHAEAGLTVEQVLERSPEVLITEATPSDLSCCGLITQLKSRPGTESPVKIVMIVHGGALERARALDLGADDVISFPFDATEFAARIRTQFRERQPQEDLKTMLKFAVQREHYADVAVQSLSEEATTKRRYLWVLPAILVMSGVAVLAAVLSGISNHGNRKEALRLRAEIARLNSGLGEQHDLLRRTDEARNTMDTASHSASSARENLKAQSEDLRKKVAAADETEAGSLKEQLRDTQNRLKALESESKVAETIVHNFGPSVCLLHVVMEFLDKQSGKPIRIAVNSTGQAQVDDKGMVQLDVEGSGPHLQVDIFGTGFLVRRDGRILTNHHVVEPWWQNEEVQQLIDRGAAAYALSYEAFFPGSAERIPAKLDKISPAADVATLRLDGPAPSHAELLELDDRSQASVTGDPVVLIGYPTGIEGILARAGSDVAQKIAGGNPDVNRIMTQLATEKLIRPTTTQGHIGDILKDKIVYDAATTSGGSGGPLFNRNGKVIGVNFAILKGFGGSNLAVPARYANELLK
jgi:S1-C subfamily serine protease/DNA-binding NarL/FixJ family response regulator